MASTGSRAGNQSQMFGQMCRRAVLRPLTEAKWLGLPLLQSPVCARICIMRACPYTSVRNRNELNRRRDVSSEPCGQSVSSSLFTGAGSTLYSPNSVNQPAPVNRERSRVSAILAGVATRKRAILDADLTGRDERFGSAVNKKPAKTKDFNEKSRGRDLGFLR